ncbi:antirestriction protein ArdC [Scopulibacillus darangshiensis]|uniref:Antirestriction protein ArdC n=1 Tax=Scopulibacillus darangshiensis TaxID=442528 RepID=A0A4R2NRC6_9BACL|nr:zincin-like metallopeptidase domain-containing protein [Scopulibacillus darangshiensis]TCP24463.1 antirestriction protein ArdC [Scopulibacillus darangshiensis]
MSKKVYEMITNQIIKKLEKGTVPWKKPFKNGVAVNWKTQKPYRGINTMLLDGGEYATFKQINDAGGRIKYKEKGHIVVFWKMLEVEDKDTGKEEKIPMMRCYKVFDINTQVEGLESKRRTESYDHDPIEEAEKIKGEYVNAPSFSFVSGAAYYKPFEDRVNVPPLKDFEDANKYYSTLFHELIHSTGHKERLNREGVTGTIRFGSENYSKEELIAELGASMLCGVTGIENTTIDNSASYIQSWLRALKDDKTLIVKASQQAQKASDYIKGVTY